MLGSLAICCGTGGEKPLYERPFISPFRNDGHARCPWWNFNRLWWHGISGDGSPEARKCLGLTTTRKRGAYTNDSGFHPIPTCQILRSTSRCLHRNVGFMSLSEFTALYPQRRLVTACMPPSRRTTGGPEVSSR